MARRRSRAAPSTPPGQLADGTPVDGPVALRKAILKHPEQFVRTMTEKLMTYALGRGLEYYDMPVVRGDRARRGEAELPVLVDRARAS